MKRFKISLLAFAAIFAMSFTIASNTHLFSGVPIQAAGCYLTITDDEGTPISPTVNQTVEFGELPSNYDESNCLREDQTFCCYKVVFVTDHYELAEIVKGPIEL